MKTIFNYFETINLFSMLVKVLFTREERRKNRYRIDI